MARPPKPWFREQTGWWMVYLNGKSEKLSRDKDEADRKFDELMMTRHEAPESPNVRTADIVGRVLQKLAVTGFVAVNFEGVSGWLSSPGDRHTNPPWTTSHASVV